MINAGQNAFGHFRAMLLYGNVKPEETEMQIIFANRHAVEQFAYTLRGHSTMNDPGANMDSTIPGVYKGVWMGIPFRLTFRNQRGEVM